MTPSQRTRLEVILAAVALVALLGLLSLAGCVHSAKPCPPPPDPIEVPMPVLVPCQPPPLPPVRDRLEELRSLVSLSDEEIAARTGVDPGLVRRIREAVIMAYSLDLAECRTALGVWDAYVRQTSAAAAPGAAAGFSKGAQHGDSGTGRNHRSKSGGVAQRPREHLCP